MTEEQYQEKLLAQGGVCWICGRPPKTRHLNVDHNHKTKKVRGLLCFLCNQGIGFFRDNPEFLLRAIDYLRKFDG